MSSRMLPGLAFALGLSACAPTLDWREVRPEDSPLVALFPCKPKTHARTVELAGARVRMSLYACTAGGHTYALSWADMGDPARVTPALRALREATAANLGATSPATQALRVPGMTPNPQALRVRVAGTLPDGQAIVQVAGYFAHATRVHQVNVLGPNPPDEAVQTFFDGLRLP
ncbi:hypothetical protein [Caldimonas sp.]|uniref:hypothetical protein n=1 Tax=Caldimonas sp. TaxID=2838790 RepID=UPI00391B3997